MAKANLVLPNGTKVHIEGTAEEVGILINKCSFADRAPDEPSGKKRTRKRRSSGGTAPKRSKASGPVGLITEIAQEGFFKTKRTLSDVQKKLEENGHIYAQSSLSPALIALTKKKCLRRMKEKKGWVYVRGAAKI